MGEQLAVKCGRCSADFQVDRGFEGLFVRCPSCRHFIEVPATGAPQDRQGEADVDPTMITGRPDSPREADDDRLFPHPVRPSSAQTSRRDTGDLAAPTVGARRQLTLMRVICPSCQRVIEARPDDEGFAECPRCAAEFEPRFVAKPGDGRKLDRADDARSPSESARASEATGSERGGPLGRTFVNGVGMHFNFIAAGSFQMGSPRDEPARRDDETQHPVRIGRGFYLGVALVSQQQYQAVTGKTPAAFRNKSLPVERVSWQDAMAFCELLTQREKGWWARLKSRSTRSRQYRLPTEAEWEYACRAGTKWPYWFGRKIRAEAANFDGREPGPGDPPSRYRGSTSPITRFKANPWGLIDMHGNVLQWCADWYGPYPAETVVDPVGPSSGTWRVARGGSWHHGASDCRAAARHRFTPDSALNTLGFRVAVDVV